MIYAEKINHLDKTRTIVGDLLSVTLSLNLKGVFCGKSVYSNWKREWGEKISMLIKAFIEIWTIRRVLVGHKSRGPLTHFCVYYVSWIRASDNPAGFLLLRPGQPLFSSYNSPYFRPLYKRPHSPTHHYNNRPQNKPAILDDKFLTFAIFLFFLFFGYHTFNYWIQFFPVLLLFSIF